MIEPDTYPHELRDRLAYLHAQLRSGIPANFLGALIVAALVWGHVPAAGVVTWVLLVMGVTCYRWYVRHRMPELGGASLEALEGAWSSMRAGIVASGVAWSSASLLAYPADSHLHQAAFVIVVAGLTAGGVPMLAVRFWPYAINCLLVLLVLAARLISEGDSPHIVLGATTVIMAGMMLRSAQDFSRLFEESAKLRARLERQASVDSLTGLANRREFDRAYERVWLSAAREQTPLSVIVLDADFFKIYNDHYGHLQGDDCLQQIGECLRSAIHRPNDLAARVGGEEFMVLLPGVDVEGAQEVALRIRQAMAVKAIPHEKSPLRDKVTLSIGVASDVPTPKGSREELIERADRALYQAKEAGRDRVCAWGAPTLLAAADRPA